MKVQDVMSREPFVCDPDSPIAEIAAQMRDLDIGMIPVCAGKHLEGVVTDRDIVVRAVAEELDPIGTVAEDVMSTDVVHCDQEDDIAKAAETMRQYQIRRLLVLDRKKQLVGVISLGDIATQAADPGLSAATLQEISQPSNDETRSPRHAEDEEWPGLEAINPALRSESFPH